MKSSKWFLIVLFISIFFPVSVYADTATVAINCNKSSVKAGDTISCTLQGTSEAAITDIDITVSLGEKLSFGSFSSGDSGWAGDGTDGHITLYRESSVTGTFNIGTITVTVSESATDGSTSIGMSNVKFFAGKTEIAGTAESVPITIANPSAVAKLASLSVSSDYGVLSPPFSSDTSSYILILDGDVTTFAINATAENSEHAITFVNEDNSETLDPSNITFVTPTGQEAMLIRITVGSGDGAATYSVVVRRDVSTESRGYELSSLKVGDQDIALVSGKYDYSVILNDVSSYVVEADVKDRENYELQTFVTPRTGEGEFCLIVVPKDSSSGLKSQTYTITVSKAGSNSGSPSSASSKPSTVITNPQTGGPVSIIMALVLIASFGVALYFYRKNMGYFHK